MKVTALNSILNVLSSLTLILVPFFTTDMQLDRQLGESVPLNVFLLHTPAFDLLPSTLIQKIDTSHGAWDPSSPDPSGIAYWPARESLLVVDSEVDEIPAFFTGDNVFESSLTGSLLATCSTTNIYRSGWSNEPTGVAINPNNNHIFISNDEARGKLHEIDLGGDEIYCTSDDRVTTVRAPGSGDVEGVAYGENKLFIAGGIDKKIYILDLGPNGVLGGGDDGEFSSFNTDSLGFDDVEGVEFNPDNGTLFIVSTARTNDYIGEVSLVGDLINIYNLDYLGSIARSGLAYGPSSWNPDTKSLYLASAGVDNFRDAEENDGIIWEIHLGELPVMEEAPSVIGITRQDPNPTSVANVEFLVAFSKPVIGVTEENFVLVTSGEIASASIVGVSGSDSTYTVTVNTGTGNGSLRLDLVNAKSINDRNGKPVGGPGIGNGRYEDGETYTVQKGSILIEPDILDFGDTLNHTWANTKTVTVRNVGAGPIRLEILTIGDDAPDQSMFLRFNNCNKVILNAGALCTFGVAFRPTGPGIVEGEVEFSDYLEEQSYEVYLSGNGISLSTYISSLFNQVFPRHK